MLIFQFRKYANWNAYVSAFFGTVLAALLTLSMYGRASAQATFAQLIGPSPYLCFDRTKIAGCGTSDSPFAERLNQRKFAYFHLEDFTDDAPNGPMNAPGVIVSTVSPPSSGPAVHPGGASEDSVDADDGVIDGLGLSGGSFFVQPGSAGLVLSFDRAALGGLPTDVGIVWTDGGGTTSFETFGPSGSLGTIGPVAIADGSFNGTTAEDRFFGVSDPRGITSIVISNSANAMQVDHLQYGRSTEPGMRLDFNIADADPTVDVVGGLAGVLGTGSGFDAADPAYVCTGSTLAPVAGNTCGLSFDGTDDKIVIADNGTNPALNPSGSFTVSAWFKTTNQQDWNIIVSKDGVSGQRQYDLHLNPGGTAVVNMWESDSTGGRAVVNSGTVGLADGEWHHIAGTFSDPDDGGDGLVRLYVDGSLIGASQNAINKVQSTPQDLLVGIQPVNPYPFNGEIDDVRLYNRALSSTEISKIGTGLVARLSFDVNGDDPTFDVVSSLEGVLGSAPGTDSIDPTYVCEAGQVAPIAGNTCSLSFDGTGDIVVVADDGNNPYLNPPGSFTVSAWFKTSFQGFGMIVSKDAVSNQSQYDLHINPGGIAVVNMWESNSIAGRAVVNSGSVGYADGKWHHMAGTFNDPDDGGDGNVRLYIDGALIGVSANAISGIQATPRDLRIGVQESSSPIPFNGLIDDVRFYDRALPETTLALLATDPDGDDIAAANDNCPTVFNPDQTDLNGDGFGDACVPTSTAIASNASVGANFVIGSDSRILSGVAIGNDATIGSNAEIGKDVLAGDGLAVGNNTTIAKESTIGDNVDVGSNTNVAKQTQIGSDVIVGDNSTISKQGIIADFVTIGSNCFIDKEVEIGLNTVIGNNCVIRKSAKIGANVVIGNDVQILKETVVPDGTVVADFSVCEGNPAVCAIVAPPTATFVPSTTTPVVGQTIQFDASGSSTVDPGQTIGLCEWNFGDGTTTQTSDPTVVYAYQSPGTYVVTLTVTQSDGLQSVFMAAVEVSS